MKHADRSGRRWLCALAAVSALLGGCTQVPRAEFDAYRAAAAQVTAATNEVLSDFQAAYSTAESLGYVGENLATPSPAEARVTPPVPAAEDEPAPAPGSIGIGRRGVWQPPMPAAVDPDERIVASRRAALEIVEQYNRALLALAEGTQAQEFTKEAEGLIGALRDFPWAALSEQAARTVASIAPGGGAIVEVFLTALEQAQRERDRRSFIAAVQKGAPLIEGLIDLLIADTANYRNIRYALIEREYTLLGKSAAAARSRIVLMLTSAPGSIPTSPLSGDAQEIARLHGRATRALERADAALRKFPDLSEGLKLGSRAMPQPEWLALNSADLESLALGVEQNVAEAQSLETRLDRYDAMLEKYAELLHAWRLHVRALARAAADAKTTLPETGDLVALAMSVRSAINVFENAE